MIQNEIKTKFNDFVSKGQHSNVVELLKGAMGDLTLSDEDKGWMFWNISDSYAMLRDWENEYQNYLGFTDHILKMGHKYLHWLVSDGTQKLTLYISPYGSYWDELYQLACKESSHLEENRRIRFESHRAAVAAPANRDYPYKAELSEFALSNMKQTLSECMDNDNYLFYQITYYTEYIGFRALINSNIESYIIDESLSVFDAIARLLDTDKEEQRDDQIPLLGSWQHLNSIRSKSNQANCGINNFIIQLVNSKNYGLAVECYEKAKSSGFATKNTYFIDKIEYAKQNCVCHIQL